MSRHKMIKNMDLDDEMDDVYGDEEEEYYEGGSGSQGSLLSFPVLSTVSTPLALPSWLSVWYIATC